MQSSDATRRTPGSNWAALIFNRDFLRFTAVGVAGFCVDAGILTLLMKSGWTVIASRAVSFLLAVSVTWLLNKLWTFQGAGKRGAPREYALYVGAQVVGAGINLGVFFVLISLGPSLRELPVIPLAAGAIVSLGFNYLVSKRWIFSG